MSKNHHDEQACERRRGREGRRGDLQLRAPHEPQRQQDARHQDHPCVAGDATYRISCEHSGSVLHVVESPRK